MKNKRLGVFCITSFVVLMLQSFGQNVWAEDLRDWQKGVIEGAFLFSSHLQSKNVRIDIQDNCVTLRGYVDSDLSKSLAEQMALSVKGIHQVINKLVVAPEQWSQNPQEVPEDKAGHHRLSNVTISNKVRSQLLANRVTSGMAIDVETHNRVVTVSGAVNSAAERTLTYWIVKNTQGVKTVIDKLDVLPHSTQQAIVQLAD